MKHQIISHLIALAIGAAITFAVLEWKDTSKPIPIDPKKFIINERIRIDRETVKPLMQELELIRRERDSLLTAKQRTKIIYKERQNENLNLSDSAAFNLLRERISTVELP